MTRAVTALAALLLTTTGCTYFKHGQSHAHGNRRRGIQHVVVAGDAQMEIAQRPAAVFH